MITAIKENVTVSVVGVGWVTRPFSLRCVWVCVFWEQMEQKLKKKKNNKNRLILLNILAHLVVSEMKEGLV